MQVNKVTQSVKDLTTRIFSRDPVEYNSAVNQYCEPNVTYTSGLVNLRGASKIKKVLLVESYFIRERAVDESKDVKEWNETDQVLTIPTTTTYALPISLPLIDLAFTFPSTITLTLNNNEDAELEDGDAGVEDAGLYSDEEGEELEVEGEEGKKYVVTKWVEKGFVDSIVGSGGIVGTLHTFIFRPLNTLLVLTLGSLLIFHRAHPLTDGILNFCLAALKELAGVWQKFFGKVLAGAEKVGNESKDALMTKAPRPIQRSTSALLADYSPSKVLPQFKPKAAAATPATTSTTVSGETSTATDNDFPAMPAPPVSNGHVTGHPDSYAQVAKEPAVNPGTHLHPTEVETSPEVEQADWTKETAPSYAQAAAE